MKKDNEKKELNFQFFVRGQNSFYNFQFREKELTDEQLEEGILYCFDDARIKTTVFSELAKKALLNLIKENQRIPSRVEKYFIDILNNRIVDKNDERTRHCAFLALAESVGTNNIQLLAKLTTAIKSQLKDFEIDKQEEAIKWLEVLLPKLATLEDDLVDAVIQFFEDSLSLSYFECLTEFGCKLSNIQSTNYTHRFMPLLQSHDEEERFQACIMLSPLAVNISPCPDEIYGELMALTLYTDQAKSRFAMQSLSQLEPKRLVIQSDIILRALSGGAKYQFVFEWITKLEPIILTQDITSEWIDGLVNSKTLALGTGSMFEKQACSLLVEKMNHTQLNTYIKNCLKLNDLPLIGLLLTAVRLEKLQQYNLNVLFVKYTTLLKSSNVLIRYKACDALNQFDGMLHLFPSTFYDNFIIPKDTHLFIYAMMMNTLPLLLNVIPEQFIEKALAMLLDYVSMAMKTTYWKMAIKACNCLTVLASQLDIGQIAKVIEKLELLSKGRYSKANDAKNELFIKFDETLIFLTDFHKSKLLQKEVMQPMEDSDVQEEVTAFKL